MDKIRYVNHLGQSINLWGADENNKTIVGSYRSARAYSYSHENGSLYVEPKTWQALLVCSPREKANELIELLEIDSASNETGKFYFNEWYIRCKYLGVSEIIFENKRFIKLSLTFLSQKNEWSKETEHTFAAESTETTEGLDFPLDFPFDFAGTSSQVKKLTNSSLLPADFRLKFDGNGSAVNILIGGHNYSVDQTIAQNESFFLDTEKETVYKTTPMGTVDLFPASSDTDYIYKKLDAGVNNITWNTFHTLYVTLIEHRRMPPWI